jgi:hypothetical protein
VTVSDTPEVEIQGNYTPRQIKDAVLELLKFGLVEEARKPHIYRTATTQHDAIARILEPLDLAMKVDDIRAIAYVVVAEKTVESDEEDWSHPLVRRQRLNLEQSLLIAILRQHFIVHEQEAGVGARDATVSLDDLLPRLRDYLGDLGSDAQEDKRLRNLLEQLKVHGIVSEIDAADQVAIRPIIAHLANPETLHNLLHALRAEVFSTGSAAREEDV